MTETPRRTNFIRNIIDHDLETGKVSGVVTRFPPEPNGYLHIGHAKSICLNFGIAADYKGRCHLRMDDTNPAKEEVEYIDSIKEDVRWLGFDWGTHMYYASDYYQKLYDYALVLIKAGKAYVCDLNPDQMREFRGTLTEPGKDSPRRNRSVEENLDLFLRMKAGEFPDGAMVLRAKIDMASPNLNMRDPVMYRIKRSPHPRTGDAWCIYPMYDYAHCVSDMLEGITHSICTLEFEDHRPLYDWFLDQLPVPCHPQQIEFARLNLTYTVMSKRMLQQLVQEKLVAGWDDPRLPTIRGLRRRGVTPEAIRRFCDVIGVAKENSTVDMALLETCLRQDMETTAPRVLCVHKPLKLVIENYPEGKTEEFDCPYLPDDPARMGFRKVPFSRELLIEQDDFMEVPPKKFFRLSPGQEVRLRWSYIIKCESVVKDPATGAVTELRCTYDPTSLAPDTRRVKGTIHWVSEAHSVPVVLRLYDRLCNVPNPAGGKADFRTHLNPDSLQVLDQARAESSIASAKPGSRFQLERRGYYYVDPEDSKDGKLVLNRIVALKDSWAKFAASNA